MICQSNEHKKITERFRQTGGSVYINLQKTAFIGELSTIFDGLSCFFAMIKLLRFCQYNQRCSLFLRTLRRAAPDLMSFGAMYSIVFSSFVSLFYLLFHSNVNACATWSRTASMLFEMSLLKFENGQLTDAGSFLGPFTFSLFVFVIVFVCLTMFLSILNEHFHNARKHDRHRLLWQFVKSTLFYWTGQFTHLAEIEHCSTRSQWCLGWNMFQDNETRPNHSNIEYTDHIDRLPHLMNRFDHVFCRVSLSLLNF